MNRYIKVMALAAMLIVVSAGCGKKSNNYSSSKSTSSLSAPAGTNPVTTTTKATTGSGQSAVLTVQSFFFSPSSIGEPVGKAFTINNVTAGTTHSFTLDDGSLTVDIPGGSSKSVTISKTGMFSFHCRFHHSMTGVVTVS